MDDKIISETNKIHTHDPEDPDKSFGPDDYMVNDIKYLVCEEAEADNE